jgi:hypothetical protein
VLHDNLVFGLKGYHQILKSFEEGHASISFLSRLLRGPPTEDPAIFESALPDSILSSYYYLSSSFIASRDFIVPKNSLNDRARSLSAFTERRAA